MLKVPASIYALKHWNNKDKNQLELNEILQFWKYLKEFSVISFEALQLCWFSKHFDFATSAHTLVKRKFSAVRKAVVL